MTKYTITDSPFYVEGRDEGENIARLASGVQDLWSNTHGQGGKDAGFRLVQAGFHFRTANMGLRRAEIAGTELGGHLKAILQEREDHLLAFSGSKEAITAFMSTLDLAAAAIYRLYYGTPYPSDPDKELDLEGFPPDSKLPVALPSDEREWLTGVKGANETRRLKIVRDMFTHRYFPRDLTIGAVDHRMDLDGRSERLGDLLEEFRVFVVDRLVALALTYAST